MTLEEKIHSMKLKIQTYGKAGIAFSGGKDSFFLLKLTVETLNRKKVTAFFVETLLTPQEEKRRVSYFSTLLDFNLERIYINLEGKKEIITNPRNRCYFCKKMIFRTIIDRARKMGIEAIFDGTTYSDLEEYRPGLQALDELNIKSPLRDEKISSTEIISYLQKLNIEPYYLTSSTCLATRFPYNLPLDKKLIRAFDHIESMLVGLNLYPVKVRYIPEGVRIELEPRNFAKIMSMKETVVDFCRQKGFTFITLDLGGLKSGAWD
jgi:uncharacterized protein